MFDEEGVALGRAATTAEGRLEPVLTLALALNRLGSKAGALFIP
jgi:hypothetical protein